MAITYPLSLPDTTSFQSIKLKARNAVAVTESMFTYQQRTQQNQGQRWEADVKIVPKNRTDAEVWITFLMSLKGRLGTFLMGDPAGATPLGVATGTPLVKGASQVGEDLITDGWTISTTGILVKGSYVQLGSGATSTLHKSLTTVNSNGSGEATLTLWPAITAQTSPADNAPLTISSAKGLWRLKDNLFEFDIDTAIIYGIEFAAIQAL